MKAVVVFLFIIAAQLFAINVSGQIKFDKYVDLNTGKSFLGSVVVADMNNDCLNDVVVMTGSFDDPDNDETIQIFYQGVNGELHLGKKFTYVHHQLNSGISNDCVVKAADFNSDNLNDLVVSYDGYLKVFYQSAGNVFTSSILVSISGTAIRSMDIGDLNNDGLMDIAYGGWREGRPLSMSIELLIQRTGKAFEKHSQIVDNIYMGQVKIANIDTTCYKEVVFVGHNMQYDRSIVGVVRIENEYFNTSYTKNEYPFIFYYGGFYGVDIGYYGKDIDKSLLLTTSGNRSLNWQIPLHLNGTLSDSISFFDGYEVPTQIKLADFDNDGYNDLVVGHDAWSKYSIYQDTDTNKFFVKRYDTVYGWDNPTSLDVGDLNNDGLIDIVISDQQDKVRVLYNTTPVNPVISSIVFYDCSVIGYDTLKTYRDYTVQTQSTVNGCDLLTTDHYKIIENYQKKYGIGDSLFYPTLCKKDVVYLKKNEVVIQLTKLQPDTVLNKSVQIAKMPVINYTIEGDKDICQNDATDLIFKNQNNFLYNAKWLWNNDTILANTFSVKNLPLGTSKIKYKVYFEDSNVYCEKDDSFNIQVNPIPANITIIGRDSLCSCEINIPYLVQPVNTSSIFHWNKVDIVNSNGTIASVNSPNEAKSIDINVQEINQYGCLGEIAMKQIEVQNCLKIPNIFTPNGDGINEYFEIGAINHYPEAKLQIFNRWGGLVFESNDHDNVWDGRNSTDGVYYYNLELGECNSFKSWVQVAR